MALSIQKSANADPSKRPDVSYRTFCFCEALSQIRDLCVR